MFCNLKNTFLKILDKNDYSYFKFITNNYILWNILKQKMISNILIKILIKKLYNTFYSLLKLYFDNKDFYLLKKQLLWFYN
jgi:hypothetical protein